ncbi:MAG: signal peptide peptidase SppA, partial [Sphingobium sp.]
DGFMGGGQVALMRVGKALDAVRAAHKPVLTFATAYEDQGYQLAAHASEVWINPIGGVAIMGPGGANLYYKGLIDKLGVNVNIYRVGTYKSAVEPFIRADQSPEAKQASQALADNLWQNWRDDVARARPRAKLAAYVADPLGSVQATGGDMAKAAQNAALVDRVGDEDSFDDRVAAIAGEDNSPETQGFASINFDKYVKAHTPANDGQIGVLTVAGEIVDGEGGPGTAAGDSIAMLLNKALTERDLKALVIRVDSPGGSVLASEQIRRAIAQAKEQGLPVVTSMGNVAASGGYWITTLSDKVIAEPSTITGSIGVFGILPSFEGTLAKLGVTTDGVRTTPLSGEPNVVGGISPQFNAIAQLSVEDMYRRFIGLVAHARKLTPQRVDSIAQGRVWDGGTARQIGLVDSFGGLEDAIAEAARLAKLDPAKARPYYIESEPDKLAAFLQSFMSSDAHVGLGARNALPTDLLGRQAWRQRQWAIQALEDARSLTQGAAMRASCLECRAYRAPGVVDAGQREGVLWRMLGWLGRS